MPGLYHLDLWLTDVTGHSDVVPRAVRFEVRHGMSMERVAFRHPAQVRYSGPRGSRIVGPEYMREMSKQRQKHGHYSAGFFAQDALHLAHCVALSKTSCARV